MSKMAERISRSWKPVRGMWIGTSFAAMMGLAVGCSSSVLDNGADAAPRTDRAVPLLDNGTLPPEDKGTLPPVDKGTLPPVDKGTLPPVDKGTPPPVDKGTLPPTDKGTPPPVDKGTPPPVDKGTGPYNGPFPTGFVGRKYTRLRVSGRNRSMGVYRPRGLPASPPLVLVFHGTGGNIDDAFYRMEVEAMANTHKVIAVVPQARSMSVGDWDNHSSGQVYFETYPNVLPSNNPDLALARAIINESKAAYGINPRKVYAIGFSNGAFFAQLAATALPNEIAAFGSASGGLVQCAHTRELPGSCNFYYDASPLATSCAQLSQKSGYCSCGGPEKPGPIPTSGRKLAGYITHGTGDVTVSSYYSCALAARMRALGHRLQVVLRTGGHDTPPRFAALAYAYMSQFQLP